MLYPPQTSMPRQTLALPASPTQAKRQCALQLSHEEWQDDTPNPTSTSTQAENTTEDTNNITIHGHHRPLTPAPKLTSPRSTPSPRSREERTAPKSLVTKRWQINRHNDEQTTANDRQVIVVPNKSVMIVLNTTLALNRPIKQGQLS